MEIPLTPTCVDDFSEEWLSFVLKDWFYRSGFNPRTVKITNFTATFNDLQGLLSTTYVVDVLFTANNKEETKSIFVKVPLVGPNAQNFRSMNVREHSMFTAVLPALQKYISDNCTDILQLPIPEIIYSHYSGDEKHDAFILENLTASGFQAYQSGDLDDVHLKSCLECLAQLHGTGLAFKHSVGGIKEVLLKFPDMQEQVQIKDILYKRETRKCIRRNFLPFLKYLEISDPGLSCYTGFLNKIDKNLFHILKVLNSSGLEKLLTLCHGDSKPDNFMFRKIEIDLEDMECEGLEGILIDWQGGFLGSVSNDLMWLLPPFIEANSENKGSTDITIDYYCTQLSYVLSSFGKSLKDMDLPETNKELSSLIKRGFIMEFLNVVIINPIISIPNPSELRNWYRKRIRHEERLASNIKTRPPALPQPNHVFNRAQFPKFASLYLKVGHVLGGFQELNSINFEIIREAMFQEEPEKTLPEADEHEHDIYEDEEIELSDEELEEESDTTENKGLPIWKRFFSWILTLVFHKKDD